MGYAHSWVANALQGTMGRGNCPYFNAPEEAYLTANLGDAD
jgi:hypothetical protein